MPYKNRHDQLMSQREWARKRRAAFFADKKCEWCGSTTKLVLHHLDPSTKIASVIWSWSSERQAEEIAKCVVICDHCHRDYHAAPRRKPLVHGTRNAYLNKRCRCAECRAWNANRRRQQRAIPVEWPQWAESIGN